MSRLENGWYRKLYCKQESVDYDRSQIRYNLLKINAPNIYPKLQLHEDKKHWTVNQKTVQKNETYFFLLFIVNYIEQV